MNVEIGAEAAQYPGKEIINGIAVGVRYTHKRYFNTVSNSGRPGFLFNCSFFSENIAIHTFLIK